MLPRGSEDIERSKVSSLAPRCHIELRADPPDYFRRVALRGKHPAQKKQIARLHRFHICPERLRRRWELDAKLFQPLLGAGQVGTFMDYHLPALIYRNGGMPQINLASNVIAALRTLETGQGASGSLD